MEEKKLNLILDHFIEFGEINFFPQEKYMDLYEDCDEKIKMLFVYFHQNLNGLLEYMNSRGAGAHYTANESRELIYLIDKLRELKGLLDKSKYSFRVDKEYEEWMEKCDSFLSQSGGSEIPDDYRRVILKNYEKIFSFTNQVNTGVNNPLNIKYTLKGEGAYAKVYTFKEPLSKKKFALKKLNQDVVWKELDRFKIEFEKMYQINNPYILKAYSFDDKNNSYIMEYCDYTLKDFINENNNKTYMSEKYRKNIALQLLRGLKYLHSKGLLHRDLSLSNILIKEYDDQFVIVKISDFGLIKDINLDLTSTDSEIRGTIIDDTLTSFKDYDIKNEIYVIGVILWFIFTEKRNLAKIDDSSIGKIVEKCINRNHDKRYNNVDEIMIDILNLNSNDSPSIKDNANKSSPISQNINSKYDIDKYGFSIIKAMVEDTAGNLLLYIKELDVEKFQTTDGKFVIDLLDVSNRDKVYILDSFNKLISKGYIKSLNSDNNIFKLTKGGYEVYDVFKENGVLHLENL